jgi:hypothetical protein
MSVSSDMVAKEAFLTWRRFNIAAPQEILELVWIRLDTLHVLYHRSNKEREN